jgi:hypothetical protein
MRGNRFRRYEKFNRDQILERISLLCQLGGHLHARAADPLSCRVEANFRRTPSRDLHGLRRAGCEVENVRIEALDRDRCGSGRLQLARHDRAEMRLVAESEESGKRGL